MDKTPSIRHIVVIPRTIKSFVFYINNNLKDGHYMEMNNLYIFIAKMLKPPATVQIHEMIFSHLSFYVDVKNNNIEELSYDEAANIQELKIKIKKNVIKNLMEALKVEREKVDENLPEHQTGADNLINQVLHNEAEYLLAHSDKAPSEVTRRDRDNSGKIISFDQ